MLRGSLANIQDILQHGVMQHGKGRLFLLYELVDELVQVLQDGASLLGGLFEYVFEICGRLSLIECQARSFLSFGVDCIFGAIPLAEQESPLFSIGDLAVDIVEDPGSFRVVDESPHMSVETRDDDPPDLLVALDDQLGDQEFAILALGEQQVVVLEFLSDLKSLSAVGVFETDLYNSNTVVLEYKVTNISSDYFEELRDQLLSLLKRDV